MRKRSDWYATFTWGAISGIAVTLAAALVLAEPQFRIDPICSTPSLYCSVYTWQTLFSGVVALGGALWAARRAWRGAMRQATVTANIPIELRKSELAFEQRRLEQVSARLFMYEKSARSYFDILDTTDGLVASAFRDQFLTFQATPCPPSEILRSMAEVCPLPGLRSELLDAERIVSDFRTFASDLETKGKRQGALPGSVRDELKRARKRTRACAHSVIASIKAVRDCLDQDLDLIEEERARLHGHRHPD